MDILSDVIAAVRIGRPSGDRVEWRAPWGQRFPDQPGTAGFLVVVEGSCWLLDPAEPVELGRGDVVFAPHGDGFALADDPATPLSDSRGVGPAGSARTVTLCGGYQLEPARIHPLLRELPGVIHVQPDDNAELHAAIRILDAEITGNRPGSHALVPPALDLLLVYILRSWFETHPERAATGGWAAALADPAVSTALNAIHDDPSRSWTVQDLADEARLSRAAFSRRFGALTGQPPLAYLTWWRLTVAAKLLQEPGLSLSAVASRIGYTSEFAFANAFKRRFGIPPGKFRRTSA